ncbi:MAG: hypothetical protein ABIK65_04730 [Candidatus Eisenbacteria bacterium]
MAHLEVIRATDPERIDEWNAAHDPARDGYLFSRTGWLETLASALGCSWSLYLCRAGGELAAGAAILEEERARRRLRPRRAPLPLFSFHLFPRPKLAPARLVPEGVAVIGALADRLSKTYGRLVLDLPPAVTDLRAFSWAGWRVEPRYAFVLDLPQEESPTGIRAEADPSRQEDLLVRLSIDRGYGRRYTIEAGAARIPVHLLHDERRLYPLIPGGARGRLDRQQRIDVARAIAFLPDAKGKKEIFLVGDPWNEWFGSGRIEPLRLVPHARVHREGGKPW